MLNEAVDAIIEGMEKLVEEFRSDMKQRFERLKSEVRQSKTQIKDEIDGLKSDLSAPASRSDLEEFLRAPGLAAKWYNIDFQLW